MTQVPGTGPTCGPLVLGASGKVGRALRALWPADAAPPLWHSRRGSGTGPRDIGWDMLRAPAPRLGGQRPRGLIVLAGVTSGDPAALAANSALALAALDFAAAQGIAPVLLASSAAVYGRGTGRRRETAACQPASPYAASKLAMEAAVRARLAALGPAAPRLACLRIANVAGADQLFGAMAAGLVTLDRFEGGTSPRRSYIGPRDLARVLATLTEAASLPFVLNLAAPGTVAMADLLEAGGVTWRWRDAPAGALQALDLDTGALAALCPLPRATAADLVAQARAGGWRAFGGDVSASKAATGPAR